MLYHKDIRLPDNFVAPTERVKLVWTRHADNARFTDRHGLIPRFDTLPLSKFEVIEVETNQNNKIVKIVVRGRFDAERDLVAVLIPGKTYKVKTVWWNIHTDRHETLDRSRYVG